MPVMLQSQERILGWPAYPLPRLDQKILSQLNEYDHVIGDPLFNLASGPPNPKFTTE